MRKHQDKVFFAECKIGSINVNPTLAEAIGVRWCLLR